MSANLLEVQNLTVAFAAGKKTVEVVSGISFAIAPGEVVVKATAKDGSGVSATYTVTVKPVMVTSITISGGTTVAQGKTITLSATVKPDNATNKDVTWSIESGSQYASISASGVLTAKAAGKVTVSATNSQPTLSWSKVSGAKTYVNDVKNGAIIN